MEYIKDYDFSIEYHPGKANVVADALSRKSAASGPEPDPEEELVTLASLCAEWMFIEEFQDMDVELEALSNGVLLASMVAFVPTNLQKIKNSYPELVRII